MTYQLGIDLGTTFSTAAASRQGRVEVLSLGTRSAAVPSVVFLRDTGEVLVGEAAEARGVVEPDRVAREFKRRLGDPTPLVLGGTPIGAERLSAYVLEHLLARASERMGGPPSTVVITHPAVYSPYRLDLLRDAARTAGIPDAHFVPEPQAAAVQYAADSRVADGEVVGIYDFGGGTFDAALVRRKGDGFELLGEPQGIERLGGVDIDLAVLDAVRDQAGDLLGDLDPEDPGVRSAMSRLRTECRLAKERLSADTETVVPVVMPGKAIEVTISRGQLESMIRPRLADTTKALERAAKSAGLTMADVSRVLLVGGSSRIPLVRMIVSVTTGRPVSVDADPESAIALGAARIAATLEPEPVVPVSTGPAPFAPPPPVFVQPVASVPPVAPPPPAPPAPPGPPAGGAFVPGGGDGGSAGRGGSSGGKKSSKRPLIIGGALVAVAAIIGGAIALSGGDDKKGSNGTFASACSSLLDTTNDLSLPTTIGDVSGFSAAIADAFGQGASDMRSIDGDDASNLADALESAAAKADDAANGGTPDEVVAQMQDFVTQVSDANFITDSNGDGCINPDLGGPLDLTSGTSDTDPPGTDPPGTDPQSSALGLDGTTVWAPIGDGFTYVAEDQERIQSVAENFTNDPSLNPIIQFSAIANVSDADGNIIAEVLDAQLFDEANGPLLVSDTLDERTTSSEEVVYGGVTGTQFTRSDTFAWVADLGGGHVAFVFIFSTFDEAPAIMAAVAPAFLTSLFAS